MCYGRSGSHYIKEAVGSCQSFHLHRTYAHLPIEDWERGDRNSFLKAFPLFKLKIINKG